MPACTSYYVERDTYIYILNLFFKPRICPKNVSKHYEKHLKITDTNYSNVSNDCASLKFLFITDQSFGLLVIGDGSLLKKKRPLELPAQKSLFVEFNVCV